MGLFDKVLKGFSSKEESNVNIDGSCVYSPAAGRAVSLKVIGDGVFSEGMLGKGAAIEPADGKFYSPFDGEVTMVYDTKHALGLMSAGGIELLIHIGIDTVELDGKCFDIKVKNGQKIKKGDLLAIADLKGIEKAGYKTITPVIVTNSDDFSEVNTVLSGETQVGAKLLEVVK